MSMGKISTNNNGHSLFFVMPKGGKNVHKSAEKLIGFKAVREVMITEGDCGFVVKADPDAESGKLGKAISKIVGGSARMAVCYCQYKK